MKHPLAHHHVEYNICGSKPNKFSDQTIPIMGTLLFNEIQKSAS
jgi:hypothetical protein